MTVRVVVAYAAMCAIWGTTWLAIKFSLHDLPPVTGAGVRFVIAALFLALLGRLVSRTPGAAPSRRLIAVLALTLFGGNYALTYYAETGLPSGLVAVLFGTLPFFVFGLGAMRGERVGASAIGGTLLALAGVGAISLGPQSRGDWTYILAALAAAALSAYANIALKAEAGADPFRTLPPAMLLGGAVMTACGTLFEHPSWTLALQPASIAAVLYLAILGSGVAFWLNHWVLRHLATWVVGISALIIPVIAVAVGALAGGEAFGARELGGAALVIAGVWLALRSPRRATTATVREPEAPKAA